MSPSASPLSLAAASVLRRVCLFLVVALSFFRPADALAGPPYTTDDPEPVEYRHWEVYLAFQNFWTKGQGADGTLPQIEVNYGAVPDLQLHTIVPMAWTSPDGGSFQYGPGDVEVGAKFRFVHESDWVPQIGTFPLLEVPVGSAARGLGAGHVQVLLPIWFQKTWGKWTTYGGAGFWLGNPGPGWHGSWYVGWQTQYQVAPWLSLGGEVFHGMAGQDGTPSDTRFNLGAVIDLSDVHHILLSAGHSFTSASAQAYLAYQVTLGPSAAGR